MSTVVVDPNIPNLMKFKTRKSLLQHFKKHGPKTEAETPEDYLERANRIRRKGLVRLAKRGKIRMYDPKTGEHIIIDPDKNKLLTYYIRKAILEDLY